MFRILLAFTLRLSAPAGEGDSWLGADKFKHFFTSALIQSVSYSAVRATGAGHGASLMAASGVTLSTAIGKEAWDAAGNGTASMGDIAWDAAGAAAASALLDRTIR